MRNVVIGVASAGMLAGCGTTMGDRGLSGAIIGGAVGMVTEPSQVNLGELVWKR